ncbi:hypothetical protein DAPPUDRAFT_254697 [Daphnia pulex]|uniref:Uncharacterized protein n=1 Tax=Daphnia pulex TaxID=6669 RepID=E9H7N9_DAPPU|nr:hypothetical protein DAPPUDRAFT_254697 [Daphnia pulex]|eukprot:EFX72272.1 hypothetical protein DAPPUDRAFT_254697 [Daphnia pulex]
MSNKLVITGLDCAFSVTVTPRCVEFHIPNLIAEKGLQLEATWPDCCRPGKSPGVTTTTKANA